MSGNYDLTPYESSRDDFWSDTPMQAVPGSNLTVSRAQPRKPDNPVDRVRRLFRGRMIIAIALAAVGAVTGAALGYTWQAPLWVAEGYAEIKPVMPRLEKGSAAISSYRDFMNTQEVRVEGVAMAARAMEQPEWQEAISAPMSTRAFAMNAQAKHSQEDHLLLISFADENPEIAIAGAKALITAFREDFLERRSRIDDVTAKELVEQKVTADKRLAKVEGDISQIAGIYGGRDDLRAELDRATKERDNYLEAKRQVDTALLLAEETQRGAEFDPLAPEVLAQEDPLLADLLAERQDLRRERVQRVEVYGLGSGHDRVRQIDTLLSNIEEAILAQADVVRSEYFGRMPNVESRAEQPEMIPVTTRSINTLRARRDVITERLDDASERLADVSRDQRELERLTNQRERLSEQVTELEERIRSEQANAAYQGELGHIEVNLPGAESVSIGKDRRLQLAIGGGMMGFALPVGLVLLLGLTDSRFRYSDDAAEASEKVTLLGILPNLPDRLSDPNQASIAAHCVHQIRTILQINHGSDESRAFAVSSGQRGDGKTSLALALGLSYAASGCRTLLIDTDLQRGGLSTRLGVQADEGIMDALTGADLLEYVCETDVTDLAILPIGKASPNHAGAFSPGAMRVLLEQARRHFDVVVCDTGPILGSIEATPVASAVDGVLLTVSRGQSRPLVSKALAHLEGVGATVSGLVFNRAQASDFERSVSGMNLRGGAARLSDRAGRPANGNVLSQN